MQISRLEKSVSRIINLFFHAKKGKSTAPVEIAYGKGENDRARFEIKDDGSVVLNTSVVGYVSLWKCSLRRHSPDGNRALIRGLLSENPDDWGSYARLVRLMDEGKGDAKMLERIVRNHIKSFPSKTHSLVRFLHSQGRTDEAVELAKTKIEKDLLDSTNHDLRLNDVLLEIVGLDKYEDIIDIILQKPEVRKKRIEHIEKYFALKT